MEIFVVSNCLGTKVLKQKVPPLPPQVGHLQAEQQSHTYSPDRGPKGTMIEFLPEKDPESLLFTGILQQKFHPRGLCLGPTERDLTYLDGIAAAQSLQLHLIQQE